MGDKNSHLTPGPGTYLTTLKNKRSSPAWGAGTEKRTYSTQGLHSPSPNKYNPSVEMTSKTSAKWGFGSGKRTELGGSNAFPGPGNYELKSAFSSNNPK